MHISLTPELESLVKARVDSGMYPSGAGGAVQVFWRGGRDEPRTGGADPTGCGSPVAGVTGRQHSIAGV